MIVIAALVGGYILAHENLKLPSWVPVLGHNYFTLKAEFQTAQAVTPGQGQAVTIAGAKIGEIASVDLHNGVAVVTMKVTPKYALIYRDATLLLRPKTQLKDMTVEVNPGTPSSGRLHSGETIPLSQTAPDINFDEFLAGAGRRNARLPAGAAGGRGRRLQEQRQGAVGDAQALRSDCARDAQLIAQQLEIPPREHRTRDPQLPAADGSVRRQGQAAGRSDPLLQRRVRDVRQEDQNVQSTLHLLPGALSKTEQGLGKLATAFNVLGPTLQGAAPVRQRARARRGSLARVVQDDDADLQERDPAVRARNPADDQRDPAQHEGAGRSVPKLATSFSVLNELFNEIAYNPGQEQGGFLFFLDWDATTSTASSAPPTPTACSGAASLYLNCNVLPLLAPVATINPTVNILVGLLNPPSKAAVRAPGSSKARRGERTRPREAPPGAPAGHACSDRARCLRQHAGTARATALAGTGAADGRGTGTARSRRECSQERSPGPALGGGARPCRSARPRSATSS